MPVGYVGASKWSSITGTQRTQDARARREGPLEGSRRLSYGLQQMFGVGDMINLLVPHGAVNPSAAPMGLPVEGLK